MDLSYLALFLLPYVRTTGAKDDNVREILRDRIVDAAYHAGTNGRLYNYHGHIKLTADELPGKHVELGMNMPYIGAIYNYTIVSQHGYIAFGTMLNDVDIRFGGAVAWPDHVDPALVAVYAMRQRPAGGDILSDDDQTRGVFIQLVKGSQNGSSRIHSPDEKPNDRPYEHVDQLFLDTVTRDLRDGMAGAGSFTPIYAIVVTWANMTYSHNSDENPSAFQTSTYQAVILTDGTLTYVVINYYELAYSSDDIGGTNPRMKAQAAYNGGNHTGMWYVDPNLSVTTDRRFLAKFSAVPHQALGRYMARVDERVQRGGCTNMSSNYPLTMHPEIVNMLGSRVEVNGPCFGEKSSVKLRLSRETEEKHECFAVNRAKAVCVVKRRYQIGSEFVRLTSDNKVEDAWYKQFYGNLYFAPPTEDPYGLVLPGLSDWFNAQPKSLEIQFYWQNYTYQSNYRRITNATLDKKIHNMELELWGFWEPERETDAKLVKIATFPIAEMLLQQQPQIGKTREIRLSLLENRALRTMHKPTIVHDRWQSFTIGLLRLSGGGFESQSANNENLGDMDVAKTAPRTEQWSRPIGLQWLSSRKSNRIDQAQMQHWAKEKCLEWFESDGMMVNYVRVTETHIPCPCKVDQAAIDVGRFMPHRCNHSFKRLDCDIQEGAQDCYISAQNVQSATQTSHGQLCCYNTYGNLLQSSYMPVLNAETDTINPGYAQRAYEYGADPYAHRFKVPGLSHFQHDAMPYFTCCRWVPNNEYCRFFSWRRPTSGCNNYSPPAVGTVLGVGHVSTFDGGEYTLDREGEFTLMYKPTMLDHSGTRVGPTIVQIRSERYPNRAQNYLNKHLHQEDLVQPTNACVVTGVVMKQFGITGNNDSSVVHVMLRKDQRRRRYRMNILVDGELVFLDSLPLRRFRGVTIYGRSDTQQSDVYVVLEAAQIGVRIRESFGKEDYAHNAQYQESPGILDVMVSVPSKYLQATTTTSTDDMDLSTLDVVTGLLGTYTGTIDDDWQTGNEHPNPRILDEGRNIDASPFTVNNSARGALNLTQTGAQADNFFKTWRIPGGIVTDNLFNPSTSSPGGTYDVTHFTNQLYSSVYTYARIHMGTVPMDSGRKVFQRLLTECKDARPVSPKKCVAQSELKTCLSAGPICAYDCWLTKTCKLGIDADIAWEKYLKVSKAVRGAQVTSCGAIVVDQPDFLYITTASKSNGMYLDGEEVVLDCHPNYWAKGERHYKCKNGQWNAGWQPWCRLKSFENDLKITAVVLGVVLVLASFVGIIVCCCVRRKKHKAYRKAYMSQKLQTAPKTTKRSHTAPHNIYAPTPHEHADKKLLPVKEQPRNNSSGQAHTPSNESLVDYGLPNEGPHRSFNTFERKMTSC